jgi:predicted CoA-binding protein
MAHPLEDVIRNADGFLLIGESGKGRFPAYSYHQYTLAGKRFYCLDLDGLSESRGGTKGGRVYSSVDELPPADTRDDLAIIWSHPHSAARSVELAHEAGCRRIWFSFGSGHPDAVARAEQLGLEVVEVGRCPIYYLESKTAACRAHTLLVKASGLYRQPPRTTADRKRREMW